MSALAVVADAAVPLEKKEIEQYEVQVHASSSKSEPDGSLEFLEKGGDISCLMYGNEGVVTRKELWSYYRQYFVVYRSLSCLPEDPQLYCTSVYLNGNCVCRGPTICNFFLTLSSRELSHLSTY
jgi:hypothetical protein